MITTILLAAAAAILPAQADTDTAPLQSPLSGVELSGLGDVLVLDEPGDGRTWARAATWKASFGSEGATFIPFFGSDAPRNYPVLFDLESVRIAGEDLPLSSRRRSRQGQTVVLNRASVHETYHLNNEGVEQTFVFDTLPALGELVLEVAVVTDLTVRPHGGGFRFANEHGAVDYGAATAIDADGRSIALTQSWTGAGFEIRVPDEFVRAAALPLVIDPIISTFSITTGPRRQVDIDVAYEGNNDTYQIVFSQVQSAQDFDVIAVSYNAPLGITFPPVSIDITSASWRDPRIASAYEAQQFLCVATVGIFVGVKRIWGRTREATSGARGPQFTISNTGAEDADVGGKGNSVPTVFDYMVVWQQADVINSDFDILAQAVSSDGTLTQGRITIDGDPDDMDRIPSISKSSGVPNASNAENEYMIVWEREQSSTNHDIRGQVIEYTGTMTGHSQFSVYRFSDALDPDVSTWTSYGGYGGAKHWVVAFERRTGSDYDIFAVVALDGMADNARSVTAMQDLERDLDHRDPVLAYEYQDFLVGYTTVAVNGDEAIHYSVLNVVHDDGELRTGVTERRVTLGESSGGGARVALATFYDGGGSLSGSLDGVCAWVATDAVTGVADASGAVVKEISSDVVGSQYCEANANSSGTPAWMQARGISAPLAGDTFGLECSDMPMNSFGHFIVSSQSGFVPNPAGSQGNLCLQGSIGRFNRPGEIMSSGSGGTFVLVIDSSAFPSPNGLVAVAPGETWYFQSWFRDLGPASNFSNGVSVTFD